MQSCLGKVSSKAKSATSKQNHQTPTMRRNQAKRGLGGEGQENKRGYNWYKAIEMRV